MRSMFNEPFSNALKSQELIEAISECEMFLKQSYDSNLGLRDRLRRFQSFKALGSLEHIKAQLISTFKHCEELFLIGKDHNKI